MGELDMDNILFEEEAANLFLDNDETDTQNPPTDNGGNPFDDNPDNHEDDNDNDNDDTAEVNSEDLFGEDDNNNNPEPESDKKKPESVGSGKNKGTQEGSSSEEDSTSPEPNFYSSIASALKEEGALPDLEDSEIEATQEPEDFVALIKKQVQAGIDDIHRRVAEALDNGVQPDAIKNYENTIAYLNSLTEEAIKAETPEGEDIRRRLIQQDLMNRGYKAERATALTNKFFANGDDIDEALAALEGNKEHFTSKYQQILDDAKKATEDEKKAIKKQAEELKKDILNSETVLGDIKLDKATRQKVYDNVSKPVYKDPDTGQVLTALQKYRKENENDYIKYMGLFFTLTNGFKDMDNIIKPQAKKEIKSKLRELEHTLNGTARTRSGTLRYVSTTEEKNQGTLFDNGFSIDIR